MLVKMQLIANLNMAEITVDPRDPSLLDPDFKAVLDETLLNCLSRGVTMKAYSMVRSPWEQARLYRKSRSSITINAKLDFLRKNGGFFLADCLEEVGPQRGQLGRHVTWALPGFSWHNWGEAADSFWQVDGRASWSMSQTIDTVNGPQNGYRLYAEIAEAMGLFSGGIKWGNDWPHVHKSEFSSPSKMYSLEQIDDKMKCKFS